MRESANVQGPGFGVQGRHRPNASRRPRAAGRLRGFTLVEMLVVIVIIGILAGLITNVAIKARARVKRAMIKAEIHQLELAVEAFRLKYGEYPPDFTSQAEVTRFLRKAFPRYATTVADPYTQFVTDLQNNYTMAAAKLDPATALAFWLGGLPDGASGNLIPAGFYGDPQQPFRQGLPRTDPFFKFVPERFVAVESDPFDANNPRYMRYYAPGLDMQGAAGLGRNAAPLDSQRSPYVYFRSRRLPGAGNRYEYGQVDNVAAPTMVIPVYYRHGPATTQNVCVPYLDIFPGAAPYWIPGSTSPPVGVNTVPTYNDYNHLRHLTMVRRWRNLESFQILSPGLDGMYGGVQVDPNMADVTDPWRFRYSRSGENLPTGGEDFDNITNFTDDTIEAEMQK